MSGYRYRRIVTAEGCNVIGGAADRLRKITRGDNVTLRWDKRTPSVHLDDDALAVRVL